MSIDANGMLVRQHYLDELARFKGQRGLAKVLTGIRRCGKSTVLRQYIDVLQQEGVPSSRIFYVNMESQLNAGYREEGALYRHLLTLAGDQQLFIFLDEVQAVPHWETVVSSLMVDVDCDIYLTGSNAYFLSSELSTYLTGRTISIRVLPFSFAEYCALNPPGSSPGGVYQRFAEYLVRGGMPFLRPQMDEISAIQYLTALRSDIIVKDIGSRMDRFSSEAVERIIDYLYSEIGNPISIENVAKATQLSKNAVASYLGMIAEALLFDRTDRYDLRGRGVLKTLPKYYCMDLGMRKVRPLAPGRDQGRELENLVYLELVRRGYLVAVGKAGDYEVDFVASKGPAREYYQVTQTLAGGNEERELRPLLGLQDAYPKTLITGDAIAPPAVAGVRIVSIVTWLLE